jgi:hypothetical protein
MHQSLMHSLLTESWQPKGFFPDNKQANNLLLLSFGKGTWHTYKGGRPLASPLALGWGQLGLLIVVRACKPWLHIHSQFHGSVKTQHQLCGKMMHMESSHDSFSLGNFCGGLLTTRCFLILFKFRPVYPLDFSSGLSTKQTQFSTTVRINTLIIKHKLVIESTSW